MNKKTLYLGLCTVAVIAIVCGWIVWCQFFGNAVREERGLFVRSQADYGELTDSLMPLLRHRAAFDFYARRMDLARNFKPGHYVLKRGMSVTHIARMFRLGLQTPVRVTIQNVRTPQQLAAKLAQRLDADSAAWMAAFTSPDAAREVGFTPATLFAMFIPDTYEFYWTVKPEEFLRRMHGAYDRFWTAERDARRKRSGLSRTEVMILASIVSEETNKRDEMPRIAGVYINRLRKGMRLQADPTVKYALQDFGLRRVLRNHLKTQSPYNTYQNKGLPPSPIRMPDVAAIDAVLDFEQHDYFYFCARPTFDGYHNFSHTLSEHNANARAYTAALNRRNIK